MDVHALAGKPAPRNILANTGKAITAKLIRAPGKVRTDSRRSS